MFRSLPALLVVVLLLSPPAGAVPPDGAGSPTADRGATATPVAAQVTADDPSNVTWKLGLTAEQVERTGYARPGPNIAATLVRDGDRLESRFASHALDERIAAAGSDDERFEILVNESRRLEAQIVALRTSERQAIDAFDAGRIGARELVNRLGRIHAHSVQLDDRIGRLRQQGQAIQSARIIGLADDLAVKTATLQGPVRSRTVSIQSVANDPTKVYVEAGGDAVVLAAFVDNEYVREAYIGSQRADEGPTISLQDAIPVFTDIYASAFTNVNDIEAGGQRSAGIYFVTLTTNDREEVRSFLDNRNQSVFKEFYRQPITWLSPGPAIVTEANGTIVRVNRTYPSGPMRVSVVDGETRDPVRATVAVDGTTVGQTNSFGILWTIEDRGPDRITIERRDGRRVNVSLSPPDEPPGTPSTPRQDDGPTTVTTPEAAKRAS